MVAGVENSGWVRHSDAHLWAVDQLARLERGEPVDRFGLAVMLRQRVAEARVGARACLRALVKAELLLEHGVRQGQPRQRMAILQHRQHLQGYLTPSLALELGVEWRRLYRSGATQAAEELRDLGGDPALMPQLPPWSWTDFLARHEAQSPL